MTKIAQSTVAKAFVAFVAAAMIFTMFAAPVKAQTSVEDLQKMINDLMAQIAALQGTTTTGGNCAAIPTPLTIGAQNANVTALQNYLIAAGNVIPAGATGYFGTQTRTALAAWQAANGVAPAAGYYGPITAAAMAAKCVPADGDGDNGGSTSDLKGGEGSITVKDLLSANVNIDLGKAEEVLSVEVEAIDSDVSLSRIDFVFNKRPWLYFEEANLMVDGKVVKTFDRSSDFTELSSTWRARFSGLDIVIREDEKAEITLELVVLPSMVGTRDGETVNVSMDATAIRFVDGAGITDTDGINGGINANVTFTDASSDGSLTVTESDSSPEAATIVVDKDSRTSDVEIAVVDVKAKSADMNVTKVTAELTVAGTGNNVGNVLYRAYLMNGSTELDRVSVSGTAATTTITFDDLDFDIEEDDTESLSIVVDFNKGSTMGTTTGATIKVGVVAVTADNPIYVDVTKTVSINETHDIVQDGLTAKAANITVSKTDNVTTVVYKFDVTAYGDDFWVSATTATAVAHSFTLPATTTQQTAPTIDVSGLSVNSDNNYKISEGSTRTITVTYNFTNTGTVLGYVTGHLVSLDYGVAANDATSATAITLGATDYKLPSNVSVNAPTN